jgi:hypothetical protein
MGVSHAETGQVRHMTEAVMVLAELAAKGFERIGRV